MARPVFEKGPLSFSVTNIAGLGGGANIGIKEGLLVEPDAATGRIKLATLDSALCLGVAVGNATASDYSNADTANFWGDTVVNMHYPPNEVAVAYQGVWLLTATAATIAFGALVSCGAGGLVKAWVNVAAAAQSNTHIIIGRCVEPGGIAANGKGKILLGGVGA
jgi:hypothetical protein